MIKILISGITGQCGATAAKMALEKGHEVVGIVRRTATNNRGRLDEMNIINDIKIVECDIMDTGRLTSTFLEEKPDVVLNAAANSHVGESFNSPAANLRITGEGVLNMLTAAAACSHEVSFFQFGSSEQFGSNFTHDFQTYSADTGIGRNILNLRSQSCYQNEDTPFSANSPYAAAKIYAHNIADLYGRIHENLKVFPMLFHNMEGPYRGQNFLTRKVTKYVGKLVANDGKLEPLELGNLDARRDWSNVKDSMAAIFHLLDSNTAPGVFMACSNNVYSVRDFCREAFAAAGYKWDNYVIINPKFFRPCEVPYLRGDSAKLRKTGWSPQYTFENLVKEMVDHDIRRANSGICNF